MDLGTFSVSLSVADIGRSLAFYRTLGFEVIDGEQEQGWLILRNGEAKIGLFQGMFEGNVITFNPPDARAIQARLDDAGVDLIQRAEPGSGPCSLTMLDPDGNAVLVDQHAE